MPPIPTAGCAGCCVGSGCCVGCVVCLGCAGCCVDPGCCVGCVGCGVCPGAVLLSVAGSCVAVSGWSETSSVVVPGTTGGWASFIMSMYFLKNLGSMICSDSVI